MKTILLTTVIALGLLPGLSSMAEARPQQQSYIFISGYQHCGTPIYKIRYIAGYERCGRPIWRVRTLSRHEVRRYRAADCGSSYRSSHSGNRHGGYSYQRRSCSSW